jgi:hypothetical protein
VVVIGTIGTLLLGAAEIVIESGAMLKGEPTDRPRLGIVTVTANIKYCGDLLAA